MRLGNAAKLETGARHEAPSGNACGDRRDDRPAVVTRARDVLDPLTDDVVSPEVAPRVQVIASHLSKQFRRVGGEEVHALDDISLEVVEGEFLVLLGPSGCGKTTLLRCLAGLEDPDSGDVSMGGKLVFSSRQRVKVPPEGRALSMLFQTYALWPHMTVLENVAYPLRSAHVSKSEANSRAIAMLERVECAHLVAQHPGQISGGQQQRVALARSLVSNHKVVLFDEPLSNVDAKVRENLRLQLRALQREIGFAAVYVTHDQSEALALADRIAVLENGKIAQLGAPAAIYSRPASRYVARFVGKLNELPSAGRAQGGFSISPVAPPSGDVTDVILAFRPESGIVTRDRPEHLNGGKAVITEAVYLGSHSEYVLDAGGGVVLRTMQMGDGGQFAIGDEVWVNVSPEDVLVLPASPLDASGGDIDGD